MSRRSLATAAMALIVLAVGIRAHADLLVKSDFSVNRYDEVSGAFLGAFAQGVVGVGLTFKEDNFRHDGHLYLSDEVNGDVLRFNGHTGVSLGIFAFGIDTPRFLIFGPDGKLYVSSLFTASIVRFNGNTGAPLGTFATAPGLFPEGLVFGPDGNLYVSDENNGVVLRFNGTTGALIGTFASGGGLNTPFGLVFGPDGNLYVSSEFSNEVIRYNGTTGALIGTFASGPELSFPTGLTFSRPRGRSPITPLPRITPEH
jgi:DNA-binding beta-propeller fold protein YncE